MKIPPSPRLREEPLSNHNLQIPPVPPPQWSVFTATPATLDPVAVHLALNPDNAVESKNNGCVKTASQKKMLL